MSGDITSNFHQGNIFSQMAYESIKDKKHLLKAKVVSYIRESGGATCDEVERALELSHQTASARITEAKAAGLIIDSGQKRLTRSGRNASVLTMGVEL